MMTAMAMRMAKKQQLCNHAFLYISLLSLHDYNLKVLISHFVEDGNTRQQLSFSFPEL